MTLKLPLYTTKRIQALYEEGQIERPVLIACQSSRPPMVTVGDVSNHLSRLGSFSDVPGCRRPGRISKMLVKIAETACEPPVDYEGNAEDVPFGFVSSSQRTYYEDYRAEYGHYPMFRVLVDYFASDEATRDDMIFAFYNGFDSDGQPHSPEEVAAKFCLTRERIRQIITGYQLPERIGPLQRWQAYCDHSTYFINETSEKFRQVCSTEVSSLTFGAFAAMMTHTVMLDLVEGRFLVRRGWVKELTAWIKRLESLVKIPRTIESRISIEGLAMGGTLDARMRSVVLSQIAPALGIRTEAPDLLIFSK